MSTTNSFLQQLRAELSQIPGDAICQALAVHSLGTALDAARPFAPVRVMARPRPTAVSANLTLDFANGTSLQITSGYPRSGASRLMLSLSRHGRQEYAQAVEHGQLRASITLALDSLGKL